MCLKGLAHADLAKKIILHEFLLFYERLLCSINFCFGPVEMRQFKNNCSGLKIDWGSPHGVHLFTECVLRHYSLLFYTRFYRLGLACKQLAMASYVSGTQSAQDSSKIVIKSTARSVTNF